MTLFDKLGTFIEREPARFFLLIRAVLYLGISTWAVLDAEQLEQILSILALVIGVDATTHHQTRKRVFSPATVKDIVAEQDAAAEMVLEVGKVLLPAKATKAQVLAKVAPVLKQVKGELPTPELKRHVTDEILKLL